MTMAAKWQMLLPAGERPEYTELYEGFYHSLRINGGTDKVELEMILRDHDRKKLEDRKKLLLHMVDCLNAEYGAGSVVCKMEDVYCNMKEYIMPVYEIIERAENAMRAAGIEPHLVPVEVVLTVQGFQKWGCHVPISLPAGIISTGVLNICRCLPC